jgi:hypothetical protein
MIATLLTSGAVASAVCAVLYLPYLSTGINLGDEGYLWYGVRQVMRGDVPIRDFRAYDPGRYWWCVPWMALLGPGIRSLRTAMFAARVLGLSIAVATLALAGDGWPVAICAAVALAAWMHPPWRQVDLLACVTVTALAVVLMTTAGDVHFLLAGVVLTGAVLPIGLNHALYGAAAFIAVLVIRAASGDLPDLWAAFGGLGLGMAIGIVPFVLILLATPGLARAYWRRKIVPVRARGHTNLATAIPWIWARVPDHLSNMPRGTVLAMRLGFTLLPAVNAGIVAAVVVTEGRDGPLRSAGAAALVGLAYTHHAMSRADSPHLAVAMLPTLVAVALVAAMATFGWLLVAALAAVFLVWVYVPYDGAPGRAGAHRGLVDVEMAGTRLRLPAPLAQHLSSIHHVVVEWSDPDAPVVFLPGLAMLYPLLDRRAAVYDTFSVYPASAADESTMLNEIRRHRPQLALVDDSPLDGRDDLRFSRTHPTVWQHLNASLMTPATIALPAHHYLFVEAARGDLLSSPDHQ